MQFYEKLIFLLNLTQTTNRMLAQELQVDPSVVSRFRTGSRRPPRNHEHIKAMSAYFARRCTTEYQRQALSKMLGIKQALTMKQEPLAEILYYWLCGETDKVGRFMRTFDSLHVKSATEDTDIDPHTLNTENIVYYGNDGKRAAARTFYQHLLSLDSSHTVYVLSDESDTWISEDDNFSQDLQDWGMNLLHRGFKLCQIVPPAAPVDLAFDSITRWLPLYMTGGVSSYFYPRLRDNAHRRTLVVVPGQIAMTSNSVAQGSSSATVLTSDKRLIQAYADQFQDYLALCRPLQHIYTGPKSLMQCFTQFLSLNSARIQKVSSLSAETAPPELVSACAKELQQPNLEKLGYLYRQELGLVEGNREQREFIDIAVLANAEDVRRGTVPIILSYGDDSHMLYYTPETYILHLKYILHILETCEHYHFVPVDARTQEEGTLMVKDGYRALLINLPPPPCFRPNFCIQYFTARRRAALPGAPASNRGPGGLYRQTPRQNHFTDQTENQRAAKLRSIKKTPAPVEHPTRQEFL